MQSPAELGYRTDLYARAWIAERIRLTRAMARDVAVRPTARRVHDVRVACRRLREALDFFEEWAPLPPSERSSLSRSTRNLARSVRDLRALDVAMRILQDQDGEEPFRSGSKLLARRLEKERRSLARRAMPELARRVTRFVRTSHKLWTDDLGLPLHETEPQAEAELRAFVEERVEARRHRVDRLCSDLLSEVRGQGDWVRLRDDRAFAVRLHEVRVGIKHWRYAHELLRGLVPREIYRKGADRLRELQEAGGRAQDWADVCMLTARFRSKTRAGVRDPCDALLDAIEEKRREAAGAFVRELEGSTGRT